MIRKLLAALALAGLLLSSACVRQVSSNIKVPVLPTALPRSPTPPGTVSTPASTPLTEAAPPTATLIQPTPKPTIAGAEQTYAVAYISTGNLLNVRSGPSTNDAILETLGPHDTGLVGTGQVQNVSGSRWVEIRTVSGGTGWVNSAFITEQVGPDTFCADKRIPPLLDGLLAAINAQDGKALADLISPAHGLTIQYSATSPAITLGSADEASPIFTSSTTYEWGIGSGSGEVISGTFKDKVLPLLSNVTTATPTRHCNLLETGTSAGSSTAPLDWPYEYANLNFMALYRPAPSGQEQDWRTWAVGIEYVEGKPYVAVLVQYFWVI